MQQQSENMWTPYLAWLMNDPRIKGACIFGRVHGDVWCSSPNFSIDTCEALKMSNSCDEDCQEQATSIRINNDKYMSTTCLSDRGVCVRFTGPIGRAVDVKYLVYAVPTNKAIVAAFSETDNKNRTTLINIVEDVAKYLKLNQY